VRISIVNSDSAAAWRTIDAFTRALIMSVRPERRNVLIV